MSIRIITGDCRDVLRSLPSGSVHCCITSPPYYGLRNYQVEGQIGLEQTPDEYVAELVGVFREVRRVLRDDGTVWLNLGDSFAASSKQLGRNDAGRDFTGGGGNRLGSGNPGNQGVRKFGLGNIKPKDLLGIPWQVAFALRADGWWLRSDIIWHKPNPMPESVTDRPTSAHEHIFLLAKSARYYFDAEAVKDGSRNIRNVWTVATQPFSGAHFAVFPAALIEPCVKAGTSEKGCCAKCGAPWIRVTTKGEVTASGGKGARYHTARMDGSYKNGTSDDLMTARETITLRWSPSCSCPQNNPVPCTVLDPFGGAGTTGLVADRLCRNAILIELNESYAAMALERLKRDAGMFSEIRLHSDAGMFASTMLEAAQ